MSRGKAWVARTPWMLALGAALWLSSACTQAPVRPPAVFDKPLSFSILEDYDKGEALTEVEADFRLFQELGVTTWRGSFGWDDYEPEAGVYDFAWLHRFVELAARHGITLRPYLGYTPAWAAAPGGTDEAPWNNPPADTLQWQRFVFRLASAMRRHPNVVSFEIYNEQNSPMWWDGSVADYTEVLALGSAAVRAAGGDDRVLLGGITYADLPWLAEVCHRVEEETFDILPMHVYAETWPDDVAVEGVLNGEGYFHDQFLVEADRLCGHKPVWINETGFATPPGRKTEEDQANWWVRAVATFAADPRIEHVGIYEIKDRPLGADVIGEPENHFLGLTYPDRRKKLAFHTVQRLVALLDTGILTIADALLDVQVLAGREGALYHHLFIRPDGHQVLFLWDRTGAPVLRVRLPRTGSRVTEYALDGTGTPYPAFDGLRLEAIALVPGKVRVFEIAP